MYTNCLHVYMELSTVSPHNTTIPPPSGETCTRDQTSSGGSECLGITCRLRHATELPVWYSASMMRAVVLTEVQKVKVCLVFGSVDFFIIRCVKDMRRKWWWQVLAVYVRSWSRGYRQPTPANRKFSLSRVFVVRGEAGDVQNVPRLRSEAKVSPGHGLNATHVWRPFIHDSHRRADHTK